jgi:AcrR family transcriptional regulator
MELSENDVVRGQIVEAARGVFGKYGYKKTTLDEIGHAARKGKTALYYYFKNKEDVFRAVVEKEAEELGATIFQAIDKENDPVDKLKLYFIVRTNTLLKVSNFYDAMKNELLDHLPFINKTRFEYDKLELEMVKLLLKDGVRQGKFEIPDVDSTAITLVTLLKGLEIPFFVQEKIDLENYINNLFQIICTGILKR